MLFTILAASGDLNAARVAVLAPSGVTKTVIPGGSHARYVPSGHLVYASQGSLRAVVFDLQRLEPRGTPITVVPRVVVGTRGNAAFAVSAEGTLVYLEAPGARAEQELVWVDRRSGDEVLPDTTRGVHEPPNLSGGRYPLCVQTGKRSLGAGSRAPAGAAAAPPSHIIDWMPLWTPDCEHLVYGSWRGGALRRRVESARPEMRRALIGMGSADQAPGIDPPNACPGRIPSGMALTTSGHVWLRRTAVQLTGRGHPREPRDRSNDLPVQMAGEGFADGRDVVQPVVVVGLPTIANAVGDDNRGSVPHLV